MMQLGLTGSIKTDNTGFAQSKENSAKMPSRNDGKVGEFAKALGAGQGEAEQGSGKSAGKVDGEFDKQGAKAIGLNNGQNDEQDIDLAKWNANGIGSDNGDLNIKELVDVEVGSLERVKHLDTANAKQIAFVSIDSSFAEKLAPVKVNASAENGINAVNVNIDNVAAGRLATGGTAAKNAGNNIAQSNDKTQKAKQAAANSLAEVGVESSAVAKSTDKVLTRELSGLENKNENAFKNKAQISEGGELKNSSPETNGNKKHVNANEVTSAKDKNFAKTTGITVKLEASGKPETLAKSEISKGAAEVVTERASEKLKSSSTLNSQFSAAQVKVKTSNNTVSFLPETKIENLANALQQIVTTSDAKSGAPVETVSAPRFVLPQSQSVVPLKTIEVQLLPKTLGLIQVKIEVLDGKMTMLIETQSAKAEAAIKLESVQIMETIKAAGLSVEEISVRRNAELSQQDQAINDNSSDQNAHEQMANGEFGEHFDGQNNAKKDNDLDDLKANDSYNSNSLDARTGIYL